MYINTSAEGTPFLSLDTNYFRLQTLSSDVAGIFVESVGMMYFQGCWEGQAWEMETGWWAPDRVVCPHGNSTAGDTRVASVSSVHQIVYVSHQNLFFFTETYLTYNMA